MSSRKTKSSTKATAVGKPVGWAQGPGNSMSGVEFGHEEDLVALEERVKMEIEQNGPGWLLGDSHCSR